MAVYRTTKCPYCKRVIEANKKEYSNSYFGSPFKVCPHCQRVYTDERMREPALFSKPYIVLKVLWSLISVALLSYGVVIMIEGIVLIFILDKSRPNGNLIFELIFTIILTLVYLFLTKPWDFSYYIKSSLERLKDENYAEAYFKLMGRYVPDSSAYGHYLRVSKKVNY